MKRKRTGDVKIKERKLKNGKTSLFLTIWKPDKVTKAGKVGTWEYDFLGKYYVPENTKADRLANEETRAFVEQVKIKKEQERAQNINATFNLSIPKRQKVNLIDYVLKHADEAFENTGKKRSDYYTFQSLAYHLKRYKGNSTNINNVDRDFIVGFIKYLKTAKNGNFEKHLKTAKNGKIELSGTPDKIIAPNTAAKLYSKLNTILKKSIIDKIIFRNPFDLIDRKEKPKTQPSKREFLIVSEIKKLKQTVCKHEDVKNAFLFCCFVGIRFENVKNLTWGNIYTDTNGTWLSYKQIKSGTFENAPISNEALQFLPTKQSDHTHTDKIFNLPKNETTNDVLREWTAAAKINKKITFHCSRHTAATMLLNLGTPLKSVGGVLGHRKSSTTEIYAKVLNSTLVEEVAKQNGILN
jgi:integrase